MALIPPNDLAIATYHSAAPAWLSKTSIRHFQDYGPAWWKLAYIDRAITPPTPGGVEQGGALDCWLTEGEEAFGRRFVIKPADHDGRTKAGKEWAAANAGKEHLSSNDYAILQEAVAAVCAHPRWKDIERCRAQMTCRRMSAGLGLGLQARPDWLDTERGVIFDLKKTRDLSGFGKQAIDLGYHLQAAIGSWCLAGDGVAIEHAYLAAVEWERGARCRVFEIPHLALRDAQRQMRKAAVEIAVRIRDNQWTDDAGDIEALPVPQWMIARMERAEEDGEAA